MFQHHHCNITSNIVSSFSPSPRSNLYLSRNVQIICIILIVTSKLITKFSKRNLIKRKIVKIVIFHIGVILFFKDLVGCLLLVEFEYSFFLSSFDSCNNLTANLMYFYWNVSITTMKVWLTGLELSLWTYETICQQQWWIMGWLQGSTELSGDEREMWHGDLVPKIPRDVSHPSSIPGVFGR